jgi:hypothetical protein
MGPNLLKRLLPLGVIGRMADKLKCKKQENRGSRKKIRAYSQRQGNIPELIQPINGL